jgi:hypothetical protein
VHRFSIGEWASVHHWVRKFRACCVNIPTISYLLGIQLLTLAIMSMAVVFLTESDNALRIHFVLDADA